MTLASIYGPVVLKMGLPNFLKKENINIVFSNSTSSLKNLKKLKILKKHNWKLKIFNILEHKFKCDSIVIDN